MRVRLKGLNKAVTRLADGTERIYYYAWRGGPKLPGAPGSPEFIAAYNEAIKARAPVIAGAVRSITAAFSSSSDFSGLAPRTRSDYLKQLKKIDEKFGSFPIAALPDKRARAAFLDWRDELALKSQRQADYTFSVFARALSWAKDRGKIDHNPLERIGRIYSSDRVENVWTLDDEARFVAAAPPHMRLALVLAVWTGQRQGDLLKLTWAAYDGKSIKLKQGKTGRRVMIPVGAPLKAALDAERRNGLMILRTIEGNAWTPDGFRSSWRKAAIKAGITDLTFHDLRGTAVTRLGISGASEAEIATMTGHSLSDVRSILDAHYLSRDPVMAASAVAKLEKTFAEQIFQNALQNGKTGKA